MEIHIALMVVRRGKGGGDPVKVVGMLYVNLEVEESL